MFPTGSGWVLNSLGGAVAEQCFCSGRCICSVTWKSSCIFCYYTLKKRLKDERFPNTLHFILKRGCCCREHIVPGVLGKRGLMDVEALDGSCSTNEFELVQVDDLTSPPKTVSQAVLRSCLASSPLTGAPWKRVRRIWRLKSIASGQAKTACASGITVPRTYIILNTHRR